MTVDIGAVAQWLGALSIIGGALMAFWKIIKKHVIQKIDDNAETTNTIMSKVNGIGQAVTGIKEEQRIIVKGLTAALDGLHQLKCNGPVSDAREELNEHLNEQAHK
jgi:uncharacterized protein YoxC